MAGLDADRQQWRGSACRRYSCQRGSVLVRADEADSSPLHGALEIHISKRHRECVRHRPPRPEARVCEPLRFRRRRGPSILNTPLVPCSSARSAHVRAGISDRPDAVPLHQAACEQPAGQRQDHDRHGHLRDDECLAHALAVATRSRTGPRSRSASSMVAFERRPATVMPTMMAVTAVTASAYTTTR